MPICGCGKHKTWLVSREAFNGRYDSGVIMCVNNAIELVRKHRKWNNFIPRYQISSQAKYVCCEQCEKVADESVLKSLLYLYRKEYHL